MSNVNICIVGLGPWGLGSLERIISRAGQDKHQATISVDVIEPGEPGVGVHFRTLPDYILLNTKCSHISMFIENQFSDIENPILGPTLLEWVKQQGYRFSSDGYDLTNDGGREISPDDFLPRRLLGEYLNWFYHQLLKRIPKNVNLKIHKQMAIDMETSPSGEETIVLDNGERITANIVFLTTGHTKNVNASKTPLTESQQDKRHIDIDYPLKEHLIGIKENEKVGIAGFGLAAIDVLTELTIGRGGKYICDTKIGRRKYIASGKEPAVYMFSRTGVPPCPRPAISKSLESFGYSAQFFTPQQIDALREKMYAQNGDNKLDFVNDLLPLLWDEMKLVYYETSVRLTEGENSAKAVSKKLVEAWHNAEFGSEINKLVKSYGSFDPERYFKQPLPEKITSSNEYQNLFTTLIKTDLVEAYKGELDSANKAAFELFRVVRETIRYAVDYEGLSPESLLQFKKRTASMINRIIVGPPKERSEEMLALIDAGIVHVPFGPSPEITDDEQSGKIKINSTLLENRHTEILDKIIYAYIPHSSVNNSSSDLISNLYKKGRLRDFCISKTSLGSAHIDVDLHPLNKHGEKEKNIYMLGPLTEGVKYFNHYIPSPSSRLRAFRDADKCVLQALARYGSIG